MTGDFSMATPRRTTTETDAFADVTIGVIAALPVEAAAMRALIADPRMVHIDQDPNEYRMGHLWSTDPARPHRIALVTLAEDNSRNAASACADMLRSFPRIRCVIMVGIAGGVPAPDQPERHVSLGDVVVAVDGIVDYGHVRQGPAGAQLRRPVGGMSMELKRAARRLQEEEYLGRSVAWQSLLAPAGDYPMAVFARPPASEDRFRSVPHPDHPRIHFGTVGSVDVLVKSAAMRDELASRHRVMAFEMEGAGVAAAVVDRGVSWFVVRGIVDYSDEVKNNAWHAYASLVAAGCVRALLERCPPFPVWRVAPTGVPALLPEWELDRLRLLLDETADVDGRAVWHAAVDGLIPAPERPATLAELASRLAELNTRPGHLPPVIAFAEQVAARVPDRTASDLRAWVDRVGRQILHLEDRIQVYRRQLATPSTRDIAGRSPVQPALLIQIERDGIDRDACEVRYWIQRDSRQWQPEPSEPRQTTFSQLERVLDAAVRHAESEWRDVDDHRPPQVELLLPADLLHLAVEWWRIELDSGTPAPLCLDYQVVVRSLDRMRAAHRRRVWQQRWRSLRQRPSGQAVYWGRLEPGSGELSHWNARLRNDPGLTTVILGSSPNDEPGSLELRSALNAGIPVILWDHRPGSLAPEMAELLSRLSEAGPGEFLDRVQDLRREAARLADTGQNGHLGRYLAVLWDDPDRNVYNGGPQL